MGRCIIVGAGEFSLSSWCYEEGDYLIAADGGYDHLQEIGITPDMLIGDMDSIRLNHLAQEIQVKRLPVEKDDTDMLAAIKEGLRLGYREFHLYGTLGGERMDHSLANIQCLLYLYNRSAKGILYGVHDRVELLCNDKIYYPASMKGIFSVFALFGDAKGVTEQGLKYSLQDATVNMEFPIGISNEFIGQESMISVKEGKLLICIHELE